MRIDPDLVRKIIIYVEDNATVEYGVNSDEISNKLTDYSHQTLLYHLRYMDKCDFFEGVSETLDGDVEIEDLTPKGHEFAETIRSDTIWNKTKEKANSLGLLTVKALYQIAIDVSASLISKSMGL
mgnify:CR=1 FL=1|jgi:hypothetical protein